MSWEKERKWGGVLQLWKEWPRGDVGTDRKGGGEGAL